MVSTIIAVFAKFIYLFVASLLLGHLLAPQGVQGQLHASGTVAAHFHQLLVLP